VSQITREFGDVRQLPRLTAGPGVGGAMHGEGQGFVVGKNTKLPTLKHIPKVSYGGKTGIQFSIKR
jgi:hypothetical protein